MKKHSIEYKKFLFYCGILMLLSELWKQFCLTYIVNHGTYSWWHFPFQLCSIPMYICLAFPVIPSEHACRLMLTFLMDFGLLGGIFTFFDTTGMYYPSDCPFFCMAHPADSHRNLRRTNREGWRLLQRICPKRRNLPVLLPSCYFIQSDFPPLRENQHVLYQPLLPDGTDCISENCKDMG